MARHTWFRLSSVVLVALLLVATGGESPFREISFSIAFAHYVLSWLYAKKQFARIGSDSRTMFAGLVLVALTVGLYLSAFSLVLLFAVHHVFNEVYLLHQGLGLADTREARSYKTTSIGLHFFLFFTLLRHVYPLDRIPAEFLFGGLAAFYAMFVVAYLAVRPELRSSQRIDACAFELLGLGLVGVSLFTRIGLYEIVLYHVLFWSVFPLPKFAREGMPSVVRYFGLNVGLTAFFLAFSPLAVLPWHASFETWEAQFRFWSYLHITFSFALSSAHPSWITRWFQPRAAVVTAR